MESPANTWDTAGVRARDEPNRKPFRLYFGLAYLVAGISILMYMGNR